MLLRLASLTLAATLVAWSRPAHQYPRAPEATQAPQAQPPACDPDNAGLKLPAGFCATLFADSLVAPRHMDFLPGGALVVGIRTTRGSDAPMPGGVMVLQDTNGDGRADRRHRFGSFSATEVKVQGQQIYTETGSAILRYRWNPARFAAEGGPDTIVSGLPGDRSHTAKTFVIRDGQLYVNHGSPSNSCQEQDRMKGSPGKTPCPDLETRAGIWRFSATKTGQTLADGRRFATGIRNAVAMALEPTTRMLYVMQHGRDMLQENWGFSPEKNAETPAEEMFRVTEGADFGWPYCYFDPEQKQKVLAPEYGGDGKTVGRCAAKAGNVGSFPGHWAPNALLFYTARGAAAFPARYRDGAFIAFHGSWNRAPLPQQGFKVVFQPMRAGRAAGDFEVFVDGFIDAEGKPTTLGGRPTGLVQGPDGALYVSDDSRGRIWKIVHAGTT